MVYLERMRIEKITSNLKKLVKCGEVNLVIITDTDRIGRDTSINTSFAKLLINK